MRLNINSAIGAVSTIAIAIFFPLISLAHDRDVHMAISGSAARTSEGLKEFLLGNLGQDDYPFDAGPSLVSHPLANTFNPSGHSPLSWVELGSYHQDDGDQSVNHFYTTLPKPVKGLTDGSESLGIVPGNKQSFIWASQQGMQAGDNFESWQNARNYQLAALTSSLKSTREDKLGHLLYALGNVLHLNQDLSQPDHVRNDEHFWSWHRDIENHGKKNFKNWLIPPPVSQRGWAYWRTAGFSKLEAFWDRNKYVGTTTQLRLALDRDAAGVPGEQLGLAEFSNGNFLGEDAKYAEYFSLPPNYQSTQHKHYFPFPSLYSSTTLPQLVANMTQGDTSVLYRDGTSGTHVYLRKIRDGIAVPHHSRLTYLQAALWTSRPRPWNVRATIADSKVLDDYHAVLIPKAIKYSTGILDYFFRGRITVTSVAWDGISSYTLNVRNDSGEDCTGGGFTLMTEAANGTRTTIVEPTMTSPWGNGTSKQITFAGPVAQATKYVLVYKGSIGLTGGVASDPVDAGIAIAVFAFTVNPPDPGCPTCQACPLCPL